MALALCSLSVPWKFFFVLNLAQMSLMEKIGQTPSAPSADKALFLCSYCGNYLRPFSFWIFNLKGPISNLLILEHFAHSVSNHC